MPHTRFFSFFLGLICTFLLLGCQNEAVIEALPPLHTEKSIVQTTETAPSLPTPFPTAPPIPTRTETPGPTATATLIPSPTPVPPTRIGFSSGNLPIISYRFGEGDTKILFVGGLHGGYEWNTILLSYELIDYFAVHPELIPETVSLYIIPNGNPDGLLAVTGKNGRFSPTDLYNQTEIGRFNANNVDLNRNWDCGWSPVGYWRTQTVGAGTAPFSEKETQLLRDYFLELQPVAILFWHSAANGLFAGACDGTHEPSRILAQQFQQGSGYPIPAGGFSSYPITGDASDWLTTVGIPSITIELKNHEDLDFNQNLAGILSLFAYYR